MAKHVLYTVRDNVAEVAGPVFQANNNSVAFRNFQSILKKVDYPNDFQLFQIGSFDDDTMEVVGLIPVEVKVNE